MNTLLENKSDILDKLGSFWVRNMDSKDPNGLDLVRALSRLVDLDGGRGRYEETLNLLLGRTSYRYNFEIPISLTDVTPVYNDNSTSTEITFKEFWIKIDSNITPITILADGEVLTTGLSFTSVPGFIIMYVSPFELFSSNMIHVISAEVKECNINDFTLRADSGSGDLNELVEYYRLKHSPSALELALNSVAGRVIIKEDCTILDVNHIDEVGKFIYTTDTGGVYRVDYEHTPLSIGERIYKNHVIGRAVDVYAKPAENSDNWWQPHFTDACRGDTFKFRDINKFMPDVEVPNYDVRFWAESDNKDVSEFHVHAEFTGSVSNLSLYFDRKDQAEWDNGIYWNTHFSFVALDDEVYANGIDFLFNAGLDNTALIIDIDKSILGQSLADNVEYVARRELLIGCVPIVRQWES